jgi:hypothetical protein
VHPLIQLAATRPQLLVDHAAAWADLLATECGPALAARRRQLVLAVLAAALMAVALVLCGTALMLWAVQPAQPGLSPQAWALLVTAPGLALFSAVGCGVAARLHGDGGAARRLLLQARADWSLLRAPGSADLAVKPEPSPPPQAGPAANTTPRAAP